MEREELKETECLQSERVACRHARREMRAESMAALISTRGQPSKEGALHSGLWMATQRVLVAVLYSCSLAGPKKEKGKWNPKKTKKKEGRRGEGFSHCIGA